MKRKYQKLVRDKIPSKIESNNEIPIIEILNDEDYLKELKLKLKEELNEYLSEGNIEELADLQEIIFAILKFENIDVEEFEKIRNEKNIKNGSFNDRIYLKDVLQK